MIRVDAVIDIETVDWTQFLCGAIWTSSDGVRVYHEPDGLVDRVMSLAPGSEVWAHSGGKFDFLWLLDVLAARGSPPKASISMSGASATSIRFSRGPWLRDSARLIPMRLADAARIAGEHRAKGDPGIPYEDFRHDMPAAQYQAVVDYLVGDVELLRDVLLSLIAYTDAEGIELRGTVGGSGWATAQKWCSLPDAEWPLSRVYGLARSGYRGGLCAVHRLEEPEVYRYDRKSAYPASLTLPVPTGVFRGLYAKDASTARRRGRPGVYQAVVRVPESRQPPLPLTTAGRLVFPHGRLAGDWTHIELDYAEEVGCTIDEIRGGVAWEREEAVLEPYARRCFELRDSLPPWNRKSLGTWLKFLANSLTGKLGQGPEQDTIAIGDYAHDFAYRAVGISPHVWARRVWRISACAHVQMAATLTARARVELMRQIDHAGESWVYSDTDSCFATRELTRSIGVELGDWAYEGRGEDWEAVAPKVYAYTDATDAGKDVVHAKGVAVSGRVQWDSYVAGDKIEARGVESLLMAAKRGPALFVKKNLRRGLSEETRSGSWIGARLRDGNVTRAPSILEIRDL